MKKRLFFLGVCLIALSSFTASAKILTFGVQGGLNLTSTSFKNIPSSFSKDNLAGFRVGPMVEVTPLPLLGIHFDASLLYSMTRTNVDNHKFTLSTLDIPINFKWGISPLPLLRIFLSAGPYFSFGLGHGETLPKITKYTFDSSNMSVGMGVGAGVVLFRHLQIGINYQFAFNKSYTIKSESEYTECGAKARSWIISAGWWF